MGVHSDNTKVSSSVKHAYFNSGDAKFIAKLEPTPFYILDLNVIRGQIAKFTKHFPNVSVYYSTKTNPHPAIIELLASMGHGFDVATTGEIDHVLKWGADPSKLLYTHPIKSVREINYAHKQGVVKFTLDSLDELIRHHEHVPTAQHYVRVLPASNASLYDYKYKFGAHPGELRQILNYAVKHRMPIAGLSFMVGSQSMSADPWVETLGYVRSILVQYYDLIPSLRTINIGSGLPVDYTFRRLPSITEIADAVQKFAKDMPRDIRIIAEPGRYIAAPSTVLVTSVVQRVERRTQNWLYTDASAYGGLIEIIENGGHFPYPITSESQGAAIPYTIAGKTLDPDDMLGINVPLSRGIKPGDQLLIHDVGAYSSSFPTDYHCLPKPKIIVCDSEYSDNVYLTTNSIGIPGLKTKRYVTSGETLFMVSGPKSSARTRTSFQVGAAAHVEPSLYGAYLNHSCSPNLGIKARSQNQDKLEIIAIQDIPPHADAVIDYAMFEYETGPMSEVICCCGSDNCRRTICGFADLPASLKDSYSPYLADHLKQEQLV